MQAVSSAPALGLAFSTSPFSASLYRQSSNSASHCSFSLIPFAPCPPSTHSKWGFPDRTTSQFDFKSRVHKRPSFQAFAVQAAGKTEKWLLKPIGDGDSSHLNQAVSLPGAFELVNDTTTVGRVVGKADVIISVATVSGLHASLEKKDGELYVTDLDSTNGTYIDNKRIRPGAVTPVLSGSRITFGDDHLAAFQFSKVEEDLASALDEQFVKSE